MITLFQLNKSWSEFFLITLEFSILIYNNLPKEIVAINNLPLFLCMKVIVLGKNRIFFTSMFKIVYLMDTRIFNGDSIRKLFY